MSEIFIGTVLNYNTLTKDVLALVPEKYGDQQVTCVPITRRAPSNVDAVGAVNPGDTIMVYIGTADRAVPKWFVPKVEQWTSLQHFSRPSDEQFRINRLNGYFSWYDTAGDVRLGIVQLHSSGNMLFSNEITGGQIQFYVENPSGVGEIHFNITAAETLVTNSDFTVFHENDLNQLIHVGTGDKALMSGESIDFHMGSVAGASIKMWSGFSNPQIFPAGIATTDLEGKLEGNGWRVEVGTNAGKKFRVTSFGFDKAWIDKDGNAWFNGALEVDGAATFDGISTFTDQIVVDTGWPFAPDIKLLANDTGFGFHTTYIAGFNLANTVQTGALQFIPNGSNPGVYLDADVGQVFLRAGGATRVAIATGGTVVSGAFSADDSVLGSGLSNDSLTVKGFSAPTVTFLKIDGTDTDVGFISASTTGMTISADGEIFFEADGAARARFAGVQFSVMTGGGDYATAVGFEGAAMRGTGQFLSTRVASGPNIWLDRYSTADAVGELFITFRASNTQIGRIEMATASTVGYITSSTKEWKTKKGLASDDGILGFIDRIETWWYTEDMDPSSGPILGAMAEDLYPIMPWAASMGGGRKGTKTYAPPGIDYGRAAFAAIPGVQALARKMRDHDKRLQKLEAGYGSTGD